ncbi:MAG: hypothetical protein AB1408_00170 [Pseudomonadota bacterium]
MKIRLVVAALATIMPHLAYANVCEPYVGQVVTTIDIDDAIAPFKAVGPKGEFEPTAQYEARKQQAVNKLGEKLIVKKAPDGRQYLVYDADAQQLNIVTYAFDNIPLNTDALFGYGAPYYGLMGDGYTHIDVVIEEDQVITGSYKASNAYGATTVVNKFFRRTRGIYQSNAKSFQEDSLFPNADNEPYYAGSIPMAPQEAMQLKPTLQFAFVVTPKPPYYLSALYEYPSRPTITTPREITNEVSALIADFQCGLVLDKDNKVLGAFETR